jgi:hypothetical protein
VASTILNIKQASMKFADTQAGLTSAPDFTCQITSASVKAVPKLQTVAPTFCGPETQSPAASGWQLDLTWLQDWGATPSGMSQYMYDNDTALKWFTIIPVDPAAPSASGQCYVVAGDYLGAAGVPLLATAVCPVPVKPTLAPVVHSTGATAGTPGSWTPAGSAPPSSVANLIAGTPNVVTASPATAWTTGQYVQTGTAGTAGQAHWSSTAWVAGVA